MKAVLMSVKAEDCYLIMYGGKDTIVQTVRPKLAPPFTVYIFCTGDFEYNNNGFKIWAAKERVIGSFVCDNITYNNITGDILWHISEPRIFNHPEQLHSFSQPCHGMGDSCDGCRFYNISEVMCVKDGIHSAPETWRYVEYIG